MDKRLLIEQILAALRAELENYMRSARAAHLEATDEQNKAENKYDTRGLEASYLARGQSRQALEVTQALEQYGSMAVRAFAATERADLGALVTLEGPGGRARYFIGPCAGGKEITCQRKVIVVITPQSPMGRCLVGRKLGESLPNLPGAAGPTKLVAIE